MMILEHEAKALLRAVGVAVPDGSLIKPGTRTPKVRAYPVAVKAQVRSGGRGKQGGVIRANNVAQLKAAAKKLFATEFNGEKPELLLADPWLAIERELYLSVTVDSAAGGYVVLYSPRGGVNIEDGPPPARYPIGPAWKFRANELRAILEPVESDYRIRERVISLAQRLVETAAARDCHTIEINPLAKLADAELTELIALDGKVVYDEWAHYRNADIEAQRQGELKRAHKLLRASMAMGHMYVKLDGDIGLISGGAGMTMGAMDMIRDCGGKPGCFLDVSPGPASARGYKPAFALLDSDPAVKVILVSVFGGGTQMNRVARALKETLAARKSQKPVVFRLDGTYVEEVAAIFDTFGAHNHATLETAAKEAVQLTRRAK